MLMVEIVDDGGDESIETETATTKKMKNENADDDDEKEEVKMMVLKVVTGRGGERVMVVA